MGASDNMWYVLALGAAGAAVMLPILPSFHPFANSADFRDVFDHPTALPGAKFGGGVVYAIPVDLAFG